MVERGGTPGGAVARRNRMLRIYGLVAALAAASGIVYCALRPRFDLSTPEKALDTFKRAMDGRRWAEAERCLSDECRAHYAAALADRRIFDFWSPYGYDTELGRFNAEWRARGVRVAGDRATARIATMMPLGGGEQFGFDLYLLRCPDGLWRVDGPREDFELWYGRLIPADARGWGKAAEVLVR